MKILKVTTSVTVELIVPVGNITQEEIDEIHSENGQKGFYEEAIKTAEEQAKANNGHVRYFNIKAEVVDI